MANINIKIDNLEQANNSAVNFGFLGQNDTIKKQVVIRNDGTTNLVISNAGIIITNILNTITIENNPAQSDALVIMPQETKEFTLNLGTSNLGDCRSILQIASNDAVDALFILELNYVVKLSYDLVVKTFDARYNNKQTINLGSLQQSTEFDRTLRITNAGASKTIRITNINTDSNSILLSSMALPFLLQPLEINSYQFIVRFSTTLKGSKNSNLKIQWDLAE